MSEELARISKAKDPMHKTKPHGINGFSRDYFDFIHVQVSASFRSTRLLGRSHYCKNSFLH